MNAELVATVRANFLASALARLFAGRKGHGGGPCSYRAVTPEEMEMLLAVAFDAGVNAARTLK